MRLTPIQTKWRNYPTIFFGETKSYGSTSPGNIVESVIMELENNTVQNMPSSSYYDGYAHFAGKKIRPDNLLVIVNIVQKDTESFHPFLQTAVESANIRSDLPVKTETKEENNNLLLI